MPFTPDKAATQRSTSSFTPDSGQSQEPSGLEKFLGGKLVNPLHPENSMQGQDLDQYNQYKAELPAGLVRAGSMAIMPESAAARIGLQAGTSGLAGYLKPGGDVKSAAEDAAIGGGLAAGGEGAGKFLMKGADKAMQFAAGMRKNVPGVGNSLVDRGIVGTKGMISNQVDSALPGAEKKVQDLVSGLEGKIPAKTLGKEVESRLIGRHLNPEDGSVLPGPEAQNSAQAIRSRNAEISQGGGYQPEVPPQQLSAEESYRGVTPDPGSPEVPGQYGAKGLLAMKRSGDYEGYTNAGNPATSTQAGIGRTQANVARETLANSSEGAVPDALKDEQALLLAKTALDKPETIHQGLGSSMFFGKVPGSSLAASTGAQMAQKGAQASQMAAPGTLQALMAYIDSQRQQGGQ